ncbi:MAG: hypothetical protein OER12_00380 [Acidimicrobiia bacterium]|nr:hypothetical protein [Acidimicrobiia bacterium]
MRLPHRLRLFGLVLVEVLMVAGLHLLARVDGFGIDWSDINGWLDRTPFEDAAGAILLVIALGLAYWLLLSTVFYAVASRSGNSTAIRAVGWLTLPAVRRLISRAVALSIAASALASPLAPAIAKLAGADQQVVVEVDSEGRMHPPGAPPSAVRSDDVVLPPHLAPQPKMEPTEQPGEPTAVVDGTISHQVTVRRGDHLWSLSESHLERVLGKTDLGEHEIARYWVRVIAANKATIRSGNPDLIYPGEVVELPAVDV